LNTELNDRERRLHLKPAILILADRFIFGNQNQNLGSVTSAPQLPTVIHIAPIESVLGVR
jgi:hypothetical protein